MTVMEIERGQLWPLSVILGVAGAFSQCRAVQMASRSARNAAASASAW
jgi:hypothetical protein